MKKIIGIITLLLVLVSSAQAQLLYKISGNGLEKPSFIIGTFHFANVGFVDKIAGVKDALTNTEQVYGEIVMSDAKLPSAQRKTIEAMKLPAGQTFTSLLTADQMKRLNAMLKQYMSTDMNNPAVKKKMDNLKPAAVTTQLTLLMYLSKHMGEYDPTAQFDDYFQAQAVKNHENVGGLETLDFQLDLLFNKTPINRQKEQMMCLVDNQDYNLLITEKTASAFYAQNLDEIGKLFDEKLGNNCDATDEETNALLYDRNAEWVAKMPEIMKAKPTFFAVGAAHLAGQKGVLQLLKNAGYTVEGVTADSGTAQ